jgi:hypothetical protein
MTASGIPRACRDREKRQQIRVPVALSTPRWTESGFEAERPGVLGSVLLARTRSTDARGADVTADGGGRRMQHSEQEAERERDGLTMVLAGLRQGLALMPEESASARSLAPLAASLEERIADLSQLVPRRRRVCRQRRSHAQ